MLRKPPVPLTIARETPVLYLSILDYPSGWQIAAPSRTDISWTTTRLTVISTIIQSRS